MNNVMYSRIDYLAAKSLTCKDDANTSDDDDTVIDLCCSTAANKETICDDTERKKGIFLPWNWSICLKLSIVVAILFFLLRYNYSSPKEAHKSVQQLPINSTKATQILGVLCSAVERGEYTGDICDWLCNKSRNYTLTGFYEGGSKKVFKIHRNGKDLILKTRYSFPTDYEVFDDRVGNDEFINMILGMVNEQTRMDWPVRYKKHIMRLLWPSYINNRTLSSSEKKSLWALVQQEEFINMRGLQLTRTLPKIAGTCGYIYQAEYVIPFKMKSYYISVKAKILMHLMGTLKLFYEFLNEPLQWCDVKFENLGLSMEYPRRFVVIDSDMLFTESKLNAMFNMRPCTVHDDCIYFDCKSQCNNSTGFCTARTNDNVDAFCEKLIGRLFGFHWSKANRYLSACHDKTQTSKERLNGLRFTWAQNFVDV